MEVIMVMLVIILAALYMIFIALVPSAINIIVVYFLYKNLPSSYNRKLKIPFIVIISAILGFNVRTAGILYDLADTNNDVISSNESITINEGAEVKIDSNSDEISFKKYKFDAISKKCNEAVGCYYHNPEKITENLEEIIKNHNIKLTTSDSSDVEIKVINSTKNGVGYWDISLIQNGKIIAKEVHKRRIGFILEKTYGEGGYIGETLEYILSNSFWDHILRRVLNKEQIGFFETFVSSHIKVNPTSDQVRKFQALENSNHEIEPNKYITDYRNSHNPNGCENISSNISFPVVDGIRYAALNFEKNNTSYNVMAKEKYLSKIVCRENVIYFIYIKIIESKIEVLRFSNDGVRMSTDVIGLPEHVWINKPGISYFEILDNRYIIKLVDSSAPNNTAMYTTELSK